MHLRNTVWQEWRCAGSRVRSKGIGASALFVCLGGSGEWSCQNRYSAHAETHTGRKWDLLPTTGTEVAPPAQPHPPNCSLANVLTSASEKTPSPKYHGNLLPATWAQKPLELVNVLPFEIATSEGVCYTASDHWLRGHCCHVHPIPSLTSGLLSQPSA
jgi:hypothetical protein